jgi:CPA2 family monovalent cation:H+ antiporter-2
MHEPGLILTLTSALAAALALGYLTNRIGLSPIVGYLLAGVVVGPFTPGFVADGGAAAQLAEVGVILLMFGVGLQFHLEDLLAVRKTAVPGALAQSLAATAAGTAIARAFGWDWPAAIVFGLALSVESTVVLTRVLADRNALHSPVGHLAIGWLVVEDLFAVLVLVLLPALLGPKAGGASGLPLAVSLAVLKIAFLVAFVFLVGGRVIPRLLERAAAARSRELFTLTVLVVALGIAVGSAEVFGASMALGAFLAGMVVGRSEFSLRAASDALPMRDAFAVLFFVSVGMLFDPVLVLQQPGLVAATVALVLVGKPLLVFTLAWLLRRPPRTAIGLAAALAQIGEFSFLVASLGGSLKVLGPDGLNAVVGASIVSITVNPLLNRFVGPAEDWAARHPRVWRLLNARVRRLGDAAQSRQGEDAPREPRHRSVVVGYGPVGRTVSRLLRENGIQPTVVEMNLDTARRLRREGIPAVYGDASRPETLIEAGIHSAGSLILSAGGVQGGEEVIRLARELNPKIRVLARSSYVRELESLRSAGAEVAFSGEGEIALAFAETVLRGLGATPEQIDRERDRVRTELFGAAEQPGPGKVAERVA